MSIRSRLGRPYTYSFDGDSDSDVSSSDFSDEDQRRAAEKWKRRGAPQAGDGGTEEPTNGDDESRESSSSPYSKFSVGNDHFMTKGRVSKRDGRLKISVNETANSGYLANALGSGIKQHFGRKVGTRSSEEHAGALEGEQKIDQKLFGKDSTQIPKLNIVVIVIGSRGDIQPFIKIGKILENDHGHRVRIATHPAFKEFVEQDSGLEFFSVGGDPSELMAFMVKNPGLLPSLETVKAGEVGRRRAAMFEMFKGMWRACINATDSEHDKDNMKMMGEKNPFIADAIIANPPSFAHVHIAERLGIPLHMMFTFPYTPTTQFPHPLANIKSGNVDANYTNFMSYPLVEMMTWQGLGDLVNKFRVKTLGLEPVSTLWAPGQLYRLMVPHTYMWSPSLVPKPEDWGPEIDISGFVFLEMASSFSPPDDLADFLDAGPPPVYIGFGSIVVDDPDKFTKMIFKAVELAGVRALVSKGWGGIGGKDDAPENIFLLDNTPHDWLFPRVSAVVHHGGAGTTAMSLKCGKPTMIVPFFGDQPFWGAMVSKAKAGAHECVPYKKLTAERLAEGIKQCLSDEAKQNVGKIADSIAGEGDGAVNAVRSFHRSLPLRGEQSMRCSILEDRVAAWCLKGTCLRLSPLAAEILSEQKKLKWNNLRPTRHCEYNDFGGPGEPITGVGSALAGTVVDAAVGIGSVPAHMLETVKNRERHAKKKKRAAKKQQKNGDGKLGEANGNADKHIEELDEPPKPPMRSTTLSALSADPSKNMAEVLGREAGAGLRQTGVALAKAPMDLALALAQGFHNAPRLYGDDTVRRPNRISGFHSGLRASRDEFLHGIYDGWTGLYRHPYRGAKEGGFLGCVKGVGMGVGGLVLKDISAVVSPFGYTAKGLHKELQKKSQPRHFIRKARIVQGRNELRALVNGGEGKGSSSSHDDDDSAVRDVEAKVLRGWEIVQEVLAFEQRRTRGRLGGAIIRRRGRKKWQEAGALENVATAEKALAARKRGESLHTALRPEREVIERANAPRTPGMSTGRESEESGGSLSDDGGISSDAGQETESSGLRGASVSGRERRVDSKGEDGEETDGAKPSPGKGVRGGTQPDRLGFAREVRVGA